MKTLIVLLLSLISSSDAFVPLEQTFFQRAFKQKSHKLLAFRPELLENFQSDKSSLPSTVAESLREEVGYSIGPWKKSVDPDQRLIFAKFWNWHLDFIHSKLTNIRPLRVTNKSRSRDFTLVDEADARLVNLCFESEEYRRIRMTHYDGGNKIQVLQALWYPNPQYNLPVLGIEMAQFGGGRAHMMASDFQPIHDQEHDHSVLFRHLIDPIRDEYPLLQQEMSGRYYDHTHFTKSMLFSRFDDEKNIEETVVPAIQRYAREHVKMIQQLQPDKAGAAHVLAKQQAFDSYFAERDQAIHMFRAKFGNDWAEDFVYDVLFELSR